MNSNAFSRRRFISVGTAMTGVGMGLLHHNVSAQTAPPPPPPPPPNNSPSPRAQAKAKAEAAKAEKRNTLTENERLLLSLQSLIEVCCREAIEEYRERLPATLTGHIRKSWQDLLRDDHEFMTSVFYQFEAFDEFTRHVIRLLWEDTLHHFMQKAHVLTEDDMKVILVSVGTGQMYRSPWATNLLAQKARENLHSRLLHFVLEIQLHWLTTHIDRYRHNPAAHHAQLDAPEYSVALRVTRTLITTFIEAVATRERHWRQIPGPQNPPIAMRPILAEIAKYYRAPTPVTPTPQGNSSGKLAVTRDVLLPND